MQKTRMMTKKISLLDCQIGGGGDIVVQSMTNTDTNDIESTIAQVIRIVEAGAKIVRISVPSMKEVDAMRKIKSHLNRAGIRVPIVADVHFNPDIALALAGVVEKIRINPGNYVDRKSFKEVELSEAQYRESVERMAQKAQPLLKKCKEYGTAIRVGVNHGSLCDRIVSRHGNGPVGMAMSAMEWVEICESFGFNNVVFSLKASNPLMMVQATLLFQEKMQAIGEAYPLHIGVTESGAQLDGRVKSAVGSGMLLCHGVGDTLRISLTEKPENEVLFANALLKTVKEIENHKYSIRDGILEYNQEETDRERWVAGASALAGWFHSLTPLKNIIVNNPCFNSQENQELSEAILQACRIRMLKADIISCPTCARTQYNIEEALKEVKKRFSICRDLKIGVMGCVVNGPGEMADADYGIVGASQGRVIVYKGKEKISPQISVEEALRILEEMILRA